MKRTFPLSLALLTVLCCMSAAVAAAATPQAAVTATSEQAFRLDMATNRALLNVGPATVSRAEKRARALMTTCLTADLVQITDASRSDANADKALELLSEEAGVEYEMAAVKPVLTPLLYGVHRLLTLHLSASLRSAMRGYLTAFVKVQSLNACADARAWLAAGLKTGHEPRGTAQIATTAADFHRLTSNDPQIHLGDLPSAQIRALKLEKTRAGKHINKLIAGSVTSLEAWIKQVALNVQKDAITTTTTTPTTTVAAVTTSP
jgi:hypothetical protein